MKLVDWMQFFERQRREHRKVIFTTSELANVAGCSFQALNVQLARLRKRGLIVRYAQGRYGGAEAPAPEELLPFLDTGAYFTGHYALHRHDIITQVPSSLTCFTNRRHNRSRVRITPLGKFVFTCPSAAIYARPRNGVIAEPEQAFCDFLYLTQRESLKAEQLVTFRNLDCLRKRRLAECLKRYPAAVARAADRILR